MIRRPVIYAGGPCTCGKNRHVRYVIPKVPGLKASIVSCRASDAASGEISEHVLPAGAVVAVRVPALQSLPEVRTLTRTIYGRAVTVAAGVAINLDGVAS